MTTGELRLVMQKKEERMIASESFVSGAFKLGRAIFLEGVPLYYLLHIGGGYLSGDTYEQKIEVQNNATLYLTTQAATKVYKTKAPAKLTTVISLNENSHLTLLQDPLILYEDAKYEQQTEVNLKKTSSFYYSECLSPGRSSTQEPFLYDLLHTKMQIFVEGELLVYDQLRWHKGMQQSLLQMNHFTHYATYICIEQLSESFFQIVDELISSSKLEVGISTLDQYGFICKVLAHSSQQIEQFFQQLDEALRVEKNRPIIPWRKY